MLMTSNIVIDLVTNITAHFLLSSLLDYFSKFDYFHIHINFVILYGSLQ
jgi:hypothetical protein